MRRFLCVRRRPNQKRRRYAKDRKHGNRACRSEKKPLFRVERARRVYKRLRNRFSYGARYYPHTQKNRRMPGQNCRNPHIGARIARKHRRFRQSKNGHNGQSQRCKSSETSYGGRFFRSVGVFDEKCFGLFACVQQFQAQRRMLCCEFGMRSANKMEIQTQQKRINRHCLLLRRVGSPKANEQFLGRRRQSATLFGCMPLQRKSDVSRMRRRRKRRRYPRKRTVCCSEKYGNKLQNPRAEH